MCGIAGLFKPKADIAAEALAAAATRMAHTLRHRGPDGSGIWTDPGVGIALAHRRLAVIDPSAAGRQPMISGSGRFVLVCNGEIYNVDELRRELARRGHGFRGRCDIEALLAAIEEWGVEGALARTSGMYALALWDRRERLLRLARDRVGEKPLYYGWCGGTFLFGSELKALRAYDEWRGQIDRTALTLLLRHNFIPAPHSIYTGIRKLLPGYVLTLDGGHHPREYLSRYWSFEAVVNRAAHERFTGSEAEAGDRLEALLTASVQRQMRADVPVGAFLSGGLDSTAITALMQARSARPIQTFTVGFDDPAYDESAAARAIARYLGTDHHELRVTAESAVAVIPELPRLYDEPFADSSQIPTYLLATLARRHVTVALTGDGGDELFGGYQRYVLAHAIWRRLVRLPAPARTAVAWALAGCPPPAIDRALALIAPMVPPLRLFPRAGDRLHKGVELLRARCADDVYARLMSYWRAAPLVDARHAPVAPSALTRWPDLPDLAERMMAVDATGYLPDDLLAKIDRAAMSVSLETRCPFLDPALIEFAWRLPPTYRIHDGQGKWLLRQVLQRRVPRALMDRPKTGFGVPLGAWLRGPLRDWAEALLDPVRLHAEGLLDPAPIREKWLEHLNGRRNWPYHLWGVLMFQAWLEHEQRAVRAVAPRSPVAGEATGGRLALALGKGADCGFALTRAQGTAVAQTQGTGHGCAIGRQSPVANTRSIPIPPSSVPNRHPERCPVTTGAQSEQRACRGRLLFLVNNPRYFLTHRLPLALGARAAGFEVWVAAPDGEAAREIVAHGFDFHPVPMSRWGSHPWQELETFVHILRLLRTLRPDLLHAVTIKPVLYGCLAARLTGVPGVVAAIPGMSQIFSRRGCWAAVRRRLVSWGYRRAFVKPNVRVIFQNPDDLGDLVAANVVPPGNAVLIRGAGVDLRRFYASPLPAGVPIVACVARMLTSKGVGEFVAAAAKLRREGVSARFVLVGDREEGNPSSVAAARLQQWHGTGAVEWWGHRDDVPEVLAQVTLVCLPSYREGLPKVLLEAAAAARPIVTTDVPGCREVVRDGETGFIVPPRDSERLAEAIARVLRDPALARTMGLSGRALAEREFGVDQVVQRTLSTYEGLLPPMTGRPSAADGEMAPTLVPVSAERQPARAPASVRPVGVVSLSR